MAFASTTIQEGYTESNDSVLSAKSSGYRSQQGGFSVGELKYNGFTFPPSLHATATIIQEYDATQRSVKSLTLSIAVEAVITNLDLDGAVAEETKADVLIDTIRNTLAKPGQNLIVVGKGLGTLNINQAGTSGFLDIDGGPRPQVMELRPLPNGVGCKLTWLITAKVSRCSGTITQDDNLVELNWEVDWKSTEAGLMARTVSGQMEVVLRNPGANLSTLHISSSRFNIGMKSVFDDFPAMGGFRRNVSYKLKVDKRTLEFKISDVEVPSDTPFPYGVVNANVTQSVTAAMPFRDWSMTLSGTLEVAASRVGVTINTNKKFAWHALGKILEERIRRADGLKYQTRTDDDIDGEQAAGGGEKNKKATYYPQTISFSDEIYGNKFSFSVTYRLLCGTNLMFAATGLFDPPEIAGQTWEGWRNYLNDLGVDGSKVSISPFPDTHAIVDLCNPLGAQSEQEFKDTAASTNNDSPFVVNCPAESESWLKCENNWVVEFDYHTTVAQPLVKDAKTTTADLGDSGYSVDEPITSREAEYVPPILSKTSHKTFTVTMIGYAIRWGYKINAPELKTYGGANAIPVDKGIIKEKTLAIGAIVNGARSRKGCNIYRLDWKRTYTLDREPINGKKHTNICEEL